MSDKEHGLFKEIPGGLRRRFPQNDEINKAKETLYYQWWRCLNASQEYLDCCAVRGENHELAETYALFGDVATGWTPWWLKIGRKLFSERKQYPKVRALSEEAALKKIDIEAKNFLILDIPLTLRRVTILEQINELLDNHHPGKDLDVRAQSTALVQLETSKLQHKTVPLLVDVATIMHRYPDISLHQLAQKAGLAEHHLGRSTSEQLSAREEQQRREMAASRYKSQAEKLTYNAARLKFPSID